MNEHQIKLWKSMVKLIDEYLEKKITFSYLVPSLEGLLDSSEIKDPDLVNKWYDSWTPLEIINAEREINVYNEEKEKVVKEMKRYLLKELQKGS